AVGRGTVGGSGIWTAVTVPLGAGVQSLSATETDGLGDVSPASAALALTIDPFAPAAPPVVLSVAPNSGPLAIGIAAPTDSDDPLAALAITAQSPASNGTAM